MSSAVLWGIVPVVLGVALLFYRGKDQLPLFAGAAACLFLSWVAWQLPIDEVLQLGPLSFEIAPALVMFGRNFTLTQADAPLLAFIFLLQTLWVLGTHLAKPGRLFIPISLAAIGLFVLALAVEPFLYAALLIAMVALLMILLLTPQGSRPSAGVIRFLKFITFSVPFILFTGWLLTGVEANPGNFNLVFRSGLLLGLGFTFLLGVFPFHSWIPMLAKEAHPYAFGFLTFFLPSFGLIFGFGFFDRYAWLRENQDALLILVLAGALMVLIAGLWAAYERDLGRLFGFAAMLNIGFGLQAVGLGASGVEVFFALLLPSALAFWIWATASSILANENGTPDLNSLRKASAEHPLAIAALLLALFSLAGLPLLGSFPGRLALFDGVAASAPWSTVMSLVGSLGMLLAGIRMLQASLPETHTVKREWVEEAHPVKKPAPSKDFGNPYILAFVAVAAVSLLGFGLLPRLFLGAIPNLTGMFSLLVP